MPKPKPHQPTPGSIHAIHVKGVGYFPCVITRVPEVQTQEPTVFVWIDGTPRESAEACANVRSPSSWAYAWLAFCTLRPFEKERWIKVGDVRNFDASDWPIPPAGFDGYKNTASSVLHYTDDGTKRVIANLAEPWDAVSVGTITQASLFEKHQLKVQTQGMFASDPMGLLPTPVLVSSKLLRRFRKARVAITKDQRSQPAIPIPERQLAQGDLLAVPVPGGGFAAVVIAAAEPKKRGRQQLQLIGFSTHAPSREALREQVATKQLSIIAHWHGDSHKYRVGEWSLIAQCVFPPSGRYALPLWIIPYIAVPNEGSWVCRFAWDKLDKPIPPSRPIPREYREETRRCWTFNPNYCVERDLGDFHFGGKPGRVGNTQPVTPAHLRLWEEMDAWYQSLDSAQST